MFKNLTAFFSMFLSYLKFLLSTIKKSMKKLTKFFPIILLILIYILWILSDNSAAPWDESRHARNAIHILRALKNPDLFSIFRGVLFYYDFYTHLSYIVARIFFIIFGASYDSACLSVSLFWVPLMYFSVYGITRRLFNRDEMFLNLKFVWIEDYIYTPVRAVFGRQTVEKLRYFVPISVNRVFLIKNYT